MVKNKACFVTFFSFKFEDSSRGNFEGYNKKHYFTQKKKIIEGSFSKRSVFLAFSDP